jgi:hypothetical protein
MGGRCMANKIHRLRVRASSELVGSQERYVSNRRTLTFETYTRWNERK